MSRLERGDFVSLTVGDLTVRAMVVLAAPNGLSLMVMFDAALDGCFGSMPLTWREGEGGYVNLMTGHAVSVGAPDRKAGE
jgi:hypothetical protein